MKKQLTIVLLLVVTSFAFAQKMKVQSGDFDFIKDQIEFNVEFDYSKMTLIKDEKSEEQYIKDRSKDLSEKNKKIKSY